MYKINFKLKKFPKSPGVYKFYDRSRNIIYIGKAAVLNNRVRSYFSGAHDSKTEKLISEITDIKWQITPSVIEALILESNLIKKYQPKYNIREKDDKSFIQIALTAEEFPRLISIRPTEEKFKNVKLKKVFGPYTNSTSVKEILSIFRRIFTYRDCKENKFRIYQKKLSPCLFYPIGLCSAPCAGKISKPDYLKTIKQMTDFLEGKTTRVISSLKKQMRNFSARKMYEEAAIIRDRIFAFQHINDTALIKRERSLEQYKNIPTRIEAYDISNIGKDFAVGSMVVFTGGEIDKAEYRKFRIKYSISSNKYQNDPEMINQIITRRFNHQEWERPNLILIDGGKGQLSAAIKALKNYKLMIPIIAIAKGPTRRGFKLFKNALSAKILLDRKFLESIRDEAHRFAISYHRKIRNKSLLF